MSKVATLNPPRPQRIKRVLRKVIDMETGAQRAEAVDFTVKNWNGDWFVHITQGKISL